MSGNITKRNPRTGIDEYGRTAIHYASDISAIKSLLAEGLDINLQDDNGWSPLHFYAQESNDYAIRLALENGANPNLTDSYGNGPLWTATMNARGNNACVEQLLEAGAVADEKNKHGRSPLDMAKTIGGSLEESFKRHGNNKSRQVKQTTLTSCGHYVRKG